MKTAISIPDEVFHAAEEFAEWKGISRSELFVQALLRYLDEERQALLTERVNRVCEKVDTSLEPDLEASSRRLGRNIEW